MSLIIVTGASRGFGLAVTQTFLSAFPSSQMIVTARSLDSLKNDALERWALDFSSSDWLKTLQTYLEPLKKQTFHQVYLINNAGSLGPLNRIPDLDPLLVMEAISSNVSANIILTSQLLKHIKANQWTIVNVSSLAAIQSFDCWSVYCSIKAARDMFHQCIATEQGIRVLNYAPGPLDTDMQKEIRDKMPNVPLKAVYTQMHQEKKLVSPIESAQKLLSILIQDKFQSGTHVDYYD